MAGGGEKEERYRADNNSQISNKPKDKSFSIQTALDIEETLVFDVRPLALFPYRSCARARKNREVNCTITS